jgi:phosphoribosyl 1,2-cyclic phosphate phosphodiesterase
MGHAALAAKLPEGIEPAFDGLTVELAYETEEG